MSPTSALRHGRLYEDVPAVTLNQRDFQREPRLRLVSFVSEVVSESRISPRHRSTGPSVQRYPGVNRRCALPIYFRDLYR